MKKTIVFIHGAWLTSLSWENFKGFFEHKGYATLAPEWPYQSSPARTDFHEFVGRSHLLIAEAGWEEVAAYIDGWLAQPQLSERQTPAALPGYGNHSAGS